MLTGAGKGNTVTALNESRHVDKTLEVIQMWQFVLLNTGTTKICQKETKQPTIMNSESLMNAADKYK